jgi:M6 family metalloprotease-like protein
LSRFAFALLLLTSGSAFADWMDHFAVREDVGYHKAPYLGPAELMIIPVEVDGHPPLAKELLTSFFGPDNQTGFVKYYETASLGRYKPHVTIAPTVKYATCPLPAATFPNCAVARGDIAAFAAGIDMIRDVVAKARDLGADFSAIDVNGRRGGPDGWADGVMILTNTEFGGIAFPIGYYNRGDNLAGGTGGPLIVNGVKISHVAIAGEGRVTVMVHEFGHLLGLTDLYDENGNYDGLNYSFMGSWSYGYNIVLPDAETRFRLRWANWFQVQGTMRVVIPPAENTGQVYRLGFGDEYFTVENRGPGVFDGDMKARGLVVNHVDRRRLNGEEGRFQERLAECVNCDPFHPYIRLVQGDGRFQVEANQPVSDLEDLFREGDSLKADPENIPLSRDHQVQSTNYYSGDPSGFAIRDIVVRTDGNIEATLEAPASGQCDETLCAEGDGCAPVACGPRAGEAACAIAPAALAPWALVALLVALRRRRALR